MLQISPELAEKLERAAARQNKTVEDWLADVADELTPPDMSESAKRREKGIETLRKAGLLRMPLNTVPLTDQFTDEALRIAGTLPEGSPSASEILRKLRDEG